MALVSREADQDIRLIRKRGNTLKKAGLVLEETGEFLLRAYWII